MRYIKLENNTAIDSIEDLFYNTPINYSIEQLLLDHPDAVIFRLSPLPNEVLLANYDVYPLITTQQPETSDGMVAVEGTPEFKDNKWYQTWNIIERTAEEIQKTIDDNATVITDDIPNVTNFVTNMVFLSTIEMQEQRYEICNSCPSFTSSKLCKECGCIIPLKIKLKSATCPIGNW